jgi:hypothetical protein
VFRKAFLGPLYKEVEYLAKLEQQAKEAGHKRWDHRIKIHRRVAVIVIHYIVCYLQCWYKRPRRWGTRGRTIE